MYAGNEVVGLRCIRMLKILILAYQPLTSVKLVQLLSYPGGKNEVRSLLDKYSSFIRLRPEDNYQYVEFIYQSARDALADLFETFSPSRDVPFSHYEILTQYLFSLKSIKADPFRYSNGCARRHEIVSASVKPLVAFEYTAAFWASH